MEVIFNKFFCWPMRWRRTKFVVAGDSPYYPVILTGQPRDKLMKKFSLIEKQAERLPEK
jgi:hypothetical protein